MPAQQEKLTTDVLVIGAGPAGSTFSRELVADGRKVHMCDAGAQMGARAGQNLKNTFAYQRDMGAFTNIIQGLLHPLSVPTGGGLSRTLDPISYRPPHGSTKSGLNPRQDPNRNLDSAAAAYSVGGMLLHWTGAVPRQHPELERSPLIDPAEWDALYFEAEKLLNKNVDVFDGSLRNSLVKDALSRHYEGRLPPEYGVQNLPMAAERSKANDEFVIYTGTDTILDPVLSKSSECKGSLTILPQHRVKRLVWKGSKIEYAILDDLMNWREIHVYADEFVVACGTVLSAQLLWASNIRPRALGRYIIEHPIAFTQVVLRRELIDSLPPVSEGSLDPIPIPMNDPPPNIWIPVSEGRRWHCQITKDAFSYGKLPDDVDDRLIVDLRWFSSIDPVETNRVKFEEDIFNQYGMPQPTFEFDFGDADRLRMHDMMSDMLGAAQSLGGIFPGSEPRFMPWGLCLHLQGACRMGAADDGTSVVDPYLRLWGFENVRVAGNSVIPTSNACNPTLTNVALAIRSVRQMIAATS